MKKIISLIIDVALAGALILLFQVFGWLKITHKLDVFEAERWNAFFVACLVGLIFTIVVALAEWLAGLFTIATLGLGCGVMLLVLILIGPIGFWGITKLTPGWLDLTGTSFFLKLLMGWILAFIRVPSIKVTRRTRLVES